ncbi:hypothetical protein MJO28_003384 [Puccinia striiformis f. sp. tritici]|uniref:Uncharacterized protein n=1 Tax=Puccinia striiformis f. sp. tritici TaxID=168172 RepID=A0ACC0ETP5_9BASI|nr:hypothetical protein MJO28_003384 [Puccinia striiformis f. sp. tritici]KAI7965344.1 hypothetical protein MJO29_003442 [Puccinia striiformis f. sp. tritici]
MHMYFFLSGATIGSTDTCIPTIGLAARTRCAKLRLRALSRGPRWRTAPRPLARGTSPSRSCLAQVFILRATQQNTMASFIRSACRSAVSISRSVVPKHLLSKQSPSLASPLRFYAIAKRVAPPPPIIIPPKDGNKNSPDDKVLMLDVKRKVLDLLEREGPMSRRAMYDDHLAAIYPTAPFSPNPPPRPLWLRAQYSPAEERVYLTMSKFKRKLIRSLAYDGTVSVITVRKVRLLLAEIDASETSPEILYRKEKMERLVASESDKSFVWILASWIVSLKQKSLQRHQREAHALGHTAPTRFKRA